MINGINNLSKSSLIMFSAFGVALMVSSSIVQHSDSAEINKNLMWACSAIYLIIYLIIYMIKYMT